MAGSENITELLRAWGRGQESARDALLPLVYRDLKQRAASHLRRERGQSLSATDLVHEAYLRLIDQRNVDWQNRSHFYAIASQAMRRVLVDRARARKASKRDGGRERVTLDESLFAEAPRPVDLVLLDRALDELAADQPRHARLVELRYFGGLTWEEAAEVLEVSPATAKRDWKLARAWLFRRLGDVG